jgi:EmrB/QacA subfamily drug resistance transporter
LRHDDVRIVVQKASDLDMFGKPRQSPKWVLALTSIASFMAALDTLVVVTALPSIQRSLGATLSTLQWTVNAYELAYAAGVITAVALGDRLGRRRIFALGLALFTLASAACALAPGAGLLIAARAVEGIGASMVTPLSLTILTTSVPPERRATAVGIQGGVAGLAIASGPLIGGAVIQGLDWHWIFWLNVPVGLVLIGLSLMRLPESRGPATRLDPLAVALVSGGAVGIVWGLVQAGSAGWSSLQALAALGLGIALMLGFVAWERRAPQPMLPLRLFHSSTFDAAITTGFLMMGAQFSSAFLITQYLQLALGFGPLAAGLSFLPMTATPLVVAPVAGLLSNRVGPRLLMATGMLLQALGLAWFAVVASTGAGYAPLMLPLLVAGVGVSMPFATVGNTAVSAVSPADMGKASGANSTVLTLGGTFGIAVVTAVFAAHGHVGTPAGFIAGFRPALGLAAVFALLGALSALAVGRRSPAAAQPKRAPAQPAAMQPGAVGAEV